MRYFALSATILTFAMFVSACDVVEVVDADNDIFAQRFFGKVYCARVDLFVWQMSREEVTHFEYQEYFLHPPYEGETTVSRHIELAKNYDDISPRVMKLEKGTKLTISSVLYRSRYFGEGSGYVPLAAVDGFNDKPIEMGFLFPFPSLLKSSVEQAHVDTAFLVEC